MCDSMFECSHMHNWESLTLGSTLGPRQMQDRDAYWSLSSFVLRFSYYPCNALKNVLLFLCYVVL